MILTLRRAGGFAGLQQTLGTVDTAALGGAAQRALAAQLKILDQLAPVPAPGADLFRYEVEIQEPGAAVRTLVVVDEGDADRPDYRALQDLARILGLSLP